MLAVARLFLVLIRPASLLLVILMYSLGTGIVDFLGTPVDPNANLLGMAVSLLVVLGSQLLDIYFRTFTPETALPIQRVVEQRKPDLPLLTLRRLMLQAAAVCFGVGALITTLLLVQRQANPATLSILAIIFLLAFFYAVPPASFSRKGMGEVIETILITNLVPALGFLIQTGEFHRLLLMLTVPLTALSLAMRLAMALPAYGVDVARERMNMMTSMGWQRGMRFHNILIILAFLLLLLAFAFGLPWRLFWPCLLTLPIGLYQIIQIRHIVSGMKPNWNILNLTSIALVGLTAYLITLSLWIG